MVVVVLLVRRLLEGPGPGDLFDRGSYRLIVDPTTVPLPRVPPLQAPAGPVGDDHADGDLGHATRLDPEAQTDVRFDATCRGVVDNATSLDFDKVRSAEHADDAPGDVNVIAWGTGSGATPPVSPGVRVFDDKGKPVAYQFVASDRGVVALVRPGAAAPGVPVAGGEGRGLRPGPVGGARREGGRFARQSRCGHLDSRDVLAAGPRPGRHATSRPSRPLAAAEASPAPPTRPIPNGSPGGHFGSFASRSRTLAATSPA